MVLKGQGDPRAHETAPHRPPNFIRSTGTTPACAARPFAPRSWATTCLHLGPCSRCMGRGDDCSLECWTVLAAWAAHAQAGDTACRRLARRLSGSTGGGPCALRIGGGDGGESNSPSRTVCRRPLRACPMLYRRAVRLPSAASRPIQSRPLSGFAFDYATLLDGASPLNDASTARGEGAASTLTLLPKQRGREQAGGCQLLRFAACLTRPNGTSARVPRVSGPVETTHPQEQ